MSSGGEKVYFQPGCAIKIRDNAVLKIGNMVSFNNNCVITCRSSIQIGNNVIVGPNTLIFDNDHDFKSDDFLHKFTSEEVIIEDNVWIGGNVCILKGTHIKEGAVIGAGTVVKGIVEKNVVLFNKQNLQVKKYEHNG